MRVHSEGFRNQIIEMGREIDSIITYTIDDETIELGAEQLNSITPSFQGSILKSAMKQLIIDANADIPRGTEINYKFGLKVNGEYEYIDFGNYIVEKSTKKEDTRSYEIECYDAMIKTMVDYEDMALVYPISVRDYLNEISAYFNFTFKNINDEFTNYDKLIPSDLYLSADGTSLGYTFRDVLDELAQVTGSTICINNDGQLEVRYINDTGITLNEEFFNDVNVNIGEKYGKVNSIVLSRSGESDNVFLKDDASIEANGLCEIKITDNQIMNDNNRADFLPALAERLFGLEYYINELSLKGAIFLELCDRYNVSIFGETYSCVMLNDEIIVSQGIQENVFTERLDGTETDYKSSSDDDRKINKAFIMVNKQNQTIEALAESVKEIKAGVVTSKTIEGNPIHITDAGEYDLEKLYLEGNSYQETTSGKNICPTDISDWELGQWNSSGEKDTYQNRIRINRLIPCEPNKTYYFQCYKNCVFVIRTFKEDETFNSSVGMVYSTAKYTTDSNTYYLAVTLIHETDTTSDLLVLLENNEIKPFICLNSETDKTYEPYTNGPSPNPDYPQEIEVIEGSVDVEVIGKNLFDAYDLKSTNGGKIGEDGWITVSFDNTNGTSDKWPNYYTNVSKMLKPSTDYVIMLEIKEVTGDVFAIQPVTYNINTLPSQFSYNSTLKGDEVKAGTYRFINKTLDSFDICTNMLRTVITFQAGKKGSITFRLSVLVDRNTMPDTFVYEPYKSTTVSLDLQGNFLAKIGDVKDELDVVTGKLTKRIGKVVLSSSNMSTRIVLGTGDIMYRTHKLTDIAYDTSYLVLCNRYKAILDATGRKDGNIYWNSTNRTLDIIDNNSSITTIEEYETWLSQNNVTVYYILAEPYEVQLDITKIPLFEGINNVNVSTNLDPSYIATTYLTNAKTNAQYATRSQLQLTENSIQSVVKDTTTLNANLTDLQAVVGTETTNLKNALGDLSNNLEENYATNNSVLTIENSVSNIQTSLNQQIEITKEIQVNGVSKVKTTTGFTFDENGMTITKTNADTKTNIDEDGMVVYSTTGAENTEILVADAQGVKAENVQVKTWLVVGENSRFQDYSTGTGCFWIGK